MQNCASTKMTTVVAHLQDDCPISIVNHHQGCQFGQKNAKPLKFGIFGERLDRKFWFGHFLEIWDI